MMVIDQVQGLVQQVQRLQPQTNGLQLVPRRCRAFRET